jgi:hypothetical protein
MKALSALYLDKRNNVFGQRLNTRANLQAQSIEFQRDRILLTYQTARQALINLGQLSDTNPNDLEKLPPLDLKNLFRKSTREKRKLGDTYHADGELWVVGASVAPDDSDIAAEDCSKLEKADVSPGSAPGEHHVTAHVR